MADSQEMGFIEWSEGAYTSAGFDITEYIRKRYGFDDHIPIDYMTELKPEFFDPELPTYTFYHDRSLTSNRDIAYESALMRAEGQGVLNVVGIVAGTRSEILPADRSTMFVRRGFAFGEDGYSFNHFFIDGPIETQLVDHGGFSGSIPDTLQMLDGNGTTLLRRPELYDTLDIKSKFRKVAEAAGIITAEHVMFDPSLRAASDAVEQALDEISAESGLVIKPDNGERGFGVEIFKNDLTPQVLAQRLERLAAFYGPMVIERFMPCLRVQDPNGRDLSWNMRVLSFPDYMGAAVRYQIDTSTAVNVAQGAEDKYVTDFLLEYDLPEDIETQVAEATERFGEEIIILNDGVAAPVALDLSISPDREVQMFEANFGDFSATDVFTRQNHAEGVKRTRQVIGRLAELAIAVTSNGRDAESFFAVYDDAAQLEAKVDYLWLRGDNLEEDDKRQYREEMAQYVMGRLPDVIRMSLAGDRYTKDILRKLERIAENEDGVLSESQIRQVQSAMKNVPYL